MLNVNVLSRRQMNDSGGGSRFDAEAFDSHVLSLEANLLAQGGQPLGDLANAIEVPVATESQLASHKSVQYVSISSVDGRDGMIFPQEILVSDLPSRAKWMVKEGDIVASQVRPERGAIARIPADKSWLASSGFFAISGSKMAQGLAAAVYFFMRSSEARAQLVRRNRNSMFPAVAPRDVLSLVVPKFSASILRNAEQSWDELVHLNQVWTSRRLELLDLLDELVSVTGVPPSPVNSERKLDTTIIDWSDAFGAGSADRVDSEFFRAEYRDFHDRLEGEPFVALGDVFDIRSGVRVSGDDSVPIVKQSALTNSGLNFSAIDREFAKTGGGFGVKTGDILLASTAHEIAYVGRKVDLVRDLPSELDHNQAVAELMILRPKLKPSAPVSAAYVVDFLRHEVGRHQVQRCIRGLRGGHTYPRDIGKYVKIPLPDEAWMDRFDTLSTACDYARTDIALKTAKAVHAVVN